MTTGRLEPDYPIRKINQKNVFRHELGDLDALAESMRHLGLLTPIVITESGDLICGKRRLAAASQLDWTTIPVWIPQQISNTLRRHALVDDQSLSKPLTLIEQAELYTEYEQLYAQQARLRYQATQFGAQPTTGEDTENSDTPGGGDSPPPRDGLTKKDKESRVKAAMAVSGVDSSQRLERIRELQTIAKGDGEHPLVAQDALNALTEINRDGKVDPRWQRVKLNQQLTSLQRTAVDPNEPQPVQDAATQAITLVRDQPDPASMLRAAKQGTKQVADIRLATPPAPKPPPDPDGPLKRAIRLLIDLLRREHGWWDRNDPDGFGRLADDYQWNLLDSYVDGVVTFRDQAQAAKHQSNNNPTPDTTHISM